MIVVSIGVRPGARADSPFVNLYATEVCDAEMADPRGREVEVRKNGGGTTIDQFFDAEMHLSAKSQMPVHRFLSAAFAPLLRFARAIGSGCQRRKRNVASAKTRGNYLWSGGELLTLGFVGGAPRRRTHRGSAARLCARSVLEVAGVVAAVCTRATSNSTRPKPKVVD